MFMFSINIKKLTPIILSYYRYVSYGSSGDNSTVNFGTGLVMKWGLREEEVV